MEVCKGCYTWKLSCQTGGRGRRNQKIMEKRGAKKPRDSSESEEESNASRKEWLRNFSTMKVTSNMRLNRDEPAWEPRRRRPVTGRPAGWLV